MYSQVDFLKHICEEASIIVNAVVDKSKEEIIDDKILVRAIERSITIIGEACKHLDFSFRNKYPQVEWKKMAGMRDVLIHDYFGIDYDLLYEVAVVHIPVLYSEILKIISFEED